MIEVNLDYPEVKVLLERLGPTSPIFKVLTYEIAISEYAVALSHELNNRGVECTTPVEALVHVGRVQNRIARHLAGLGEPIPSEAHVK